VKKLARPVSKRDIDKFLKKNKLILITDISQPQAAEGQVFETEVFKSIMDKRIKDFREEMADAFTALILLANKHHLDILAEVTEKFNNVSREMGIEDKYTI